MEAAHLILFFTYHLDRTKHKGITLKSFTPLNEYSNIASVKTISNIFCNTRSSLTQHNLRTKMLGLVIFKLMCNVCIEKQVQNAFLREVILIKVPSIMFGK